MIFVTSRVVKNRVSQLEEKLEGLVTLLKSSHENGSSIPRPIPVSGSVSIMQPSVESSPQAMIISEAHPPDSKTPDVNQAESWDNRLLRGGPPGARFGIPETNTREWKMIAFAPENPPIYKLDPRDLGLEEDLDELLTTFRKEILPGFPFIAISDSTLASDICKDCPSLFTAIMALSTRNSSRQRAISTIFMKQIADRVVVRGERKLEILLGTLVLGAWYWGSF